MKLKRGAQTDTELLKCIWPAVRPEIRRKQSTSYSQSKDEIWKPVGGSEKGNDFLCLESESSAVQTQGKRHSLQRALVAVMDPLSPR